jgi:hypothetical protein
MLCFLLAQRTETSIHRSELRLDCKRGQMMNKGRDPEQIRANISI